METKKITNLLAFKLSSENIRINKSRLRKEVEDIVEGYSSIKSLAKIHLCSN